MPDLPTITAIRPTKRDPSRSTIRAGGRALATLPHTRIVDMGLTVGQEVTALLEAAIVHAAAVDKAMRYAMNSLTAKMQSTKKLRDKLRRREHPPEVIDEVIARLRRLDFLDDAALGRALIRETLRGKPAGSRLLRQKLMQRGLERQLIDDLITEHEQTVADGGEEQQLNDVRAFAERKLRSMQRLEPAKRKQRLWGALARRGFDVDTIRTALDGLPGLDDDEPYG